MAKNRKTQRKTSENRPPGEAVVGLRIIGGSLRGRKLIYSGDPRTRPMKDRVRESVFNLLGSQIQGSHAIDLFAGTGALGIEALSRGAAKATLIERHLPTANIIKQNAVALGISDRTQVVFGDAFRWTGDFSPAGDQPLTVFCSPPYDFYVERQQEMLDLIGRWVERCPPGSQIVVEADDRFDFQSLPQPDPWNVRTYPPAVVGILG
jgi:16S rRNA (guanine966-N2)-methyltransferase